MSMFDSGWVPVTGNGIRRRYDGTIYISISNSGIKFSGALREALGAPPYIHIYFGQADAGKAGLIAIEGIQRADAKAVNFTTRNKQANGSITNRNKQMVQAFLDY